MQLGTKNEVFFINDKIMRRHDIEPPLTHAINEDGDIKYVLDSCKIDRISLNCGNGRAIIVNRGTISNVIKDYSPSIAETEE